MKDTVQINDRFTIAKFAPEADQIRQAAQEGFKSPPVNSTCGLSVNSEENRVRSVIMRATVNLRSNF